VLICGITGKWSVEWETQDQKKKQRPTVPFCGKRPTVEMMVHWKDQGKYLARVLLDTGCSTPLISKQLVKKLSLPCLQHEQERAIRNFTGELALEAAREYTRPIILQHHRH